MGRHSQLLGCYPADEGYQNMRGLSLCFASPCKIDIAICVCVHMFFFFFVCLFLRFFLRVGQGGCAARY